MEASFFKAAIRPRPELIFMLDLLFIAITIGFFALAAAYVRGCEKLRGGDHD